MNIEIQKSKVYVLLDERNCVLRCEGGYTMSNIDDVSKWTYIDEGKLTEDEYNEIVVDANINMNVVNASN